MAVTLWEGVIYAVLIAFLFFLLWMQRGIQPVSQKRYRVRLGLSLALWTVLVLYVVQPQWNRQFNSGRVLLFSATVPEEVLQKAKDSLRITESFSINEWEQRTEEDPGLAARTGTVYLAGQDVGPHTLGLLSDHELHWLPSFRKEELQFIQWKALLRKGELQEITGRIDMEEPKMLRVTYARQVLDSVLLPKGVQSFRLRFPSFAVGRTETTLELNGQPLQNVAFYARKSLPVSVSFLLRHPDFESKMLAEWLGKNGNRVEMSTTVAKNTQSAVSINSSGTPTSFVADVIITEPENADHPKVKKAIADGKSVLFLNITQPEPAVKKINAALGTHWRIRKISNEESVDIGKGMTSLPYRPEDDLRQRNVVGYPAAVQKIGGKVGVSFVNETFPLTLSGDSLTYDAFWSSMWQVLTPAQGNAVSAVAPLWKDVRSSFVLNTFPKPVTSVSVAKDTVLTDPSVLNERTFTAEYVFRKTGWQSFQDSLEVYIEPEESTAAKAERIRAALRLHNHMAKENTRADATQTLSSKLPDWAWMLLMLLCLTALWVEPKLRY